MDKTWANTCKTYCSLTLEVLYQRSKPSVALPQLCKNSTIGTKFDVSLIVFIIIIIMCLLIELNEHCNNACPCFSVCISDTRINNKNL